VPKYWGWGKLADNIVLKEIHIVCHNTSLNGYQYFEKAMLFWQNMLFLITENEIVTLTNEATLSNENTNILRAK
jgi:hypothetical protein